MPSLRCKIQSQPGRYIVRRRQRRSWMKLRMALLAFVVAAATAAVANAQTEYPLGPDSERHPGVPEGAVTKHAWASRIFPGTERDYWLYVPAQYRPGTPAAVMVFQDGGGFVAESGRWRIPI